MSLITQHIQLGYAGNIVIDDLSVQIPQQQITALIGPNGCGKSTLLRGLAGLLEPQKGQVALQDKAMSDWSRQALALQIAMLPQKPVAPDGVLVRQLVSYGRFPYQGLLRSASREDQEVVEWAMDKTGISHYADKPVQALSGGEQQRVWIAMAIAQQATILLLDEPTTYLDWGHQLEILELLCQLNREQGLTVVMSLHDLNQAAQYSDNVIAMEQGQLIAQGTPVQVITPRLLNRVFKVRAQVVPQDNGKPYCIAQGTVSTADLAVAS
ncbi:ABC transporter ATP-binding protein [Alkalimarinus coralli]|uniref:ABC transporter ATP-binding protein n=1 Tax=Alkalimarinus coralli TaxID=2935863 RepID=UPI00202AC716|nr:ABC transporter ATP-binding protein [Alkalimarinus coralli]